MIVDECLDSVDVKVANEVGSAACLHDGRDESSDLVDVLRVSVRVHEHREVLSGERVL